MTERSDRTQNATRTNHTEIVAARRKKPQAERVPPVVRFRSRLRNIVSKPQTTGSIRVGADDFVARAGAEGTPDVAGDRALHEPNRAVHHHGIDTTGVVAP